MNKETFQFLFDDHGFLHPLLWVPSVFILALVFGMSAWPFFPTYCAYFAISSFISLIRWERVLDRLLSSSKMRKHD